MIPRKKVINFGGIKENWFWFWQIHLILRAPNNLIFTPLQIYFIIGAFVLFAFLVRPIIDITVIYIINVLKSCLY